MAELILSNVGAALGRRLAPAGLRGVAAALGRAAGARIGGGIDRALFGDSPALAGPRLSDFHLQASTEGVGVPVVFGRMRIAGQVIWAARLKETAVTERVETGGKGGPAQRRTSYRYSLSFAVGLCEGPVVEVSRAWANGAPLDLGAVNYRIHPGTDDQDPDPLIEAIEGGERTPAYRGLCYIVFEDLPLDPFGGVAPQLSFEVVRPPKPRAGAPPRLESLARAVCIIPGAGEFAYATDIVRIERGEEDAFANAHALSDRADFLVSLDQMQAALPAVEAAIITVGWFGDDLRCGQCTVRPGVDQAQKTTLPLQWSVGQEDRSAARLISAINGRAAYGGTPCDASVLQAVAEMKRRGLKVGLHPFLFMDIPADNTRADPYGGVRQAAYPWRGRITVDPAPGVAGTSDGTAQARTQIDAFFGAASAADFVIEPGRVRYIGGGERSFSRFVLHQAALAAAAGGVDFFVIGSELKALTTVRDETGDYPAVEHLRRLAREVRTLTPGAAITYAADWSEYFGHQPTDGSGDVRFHLDPLWADPEIDVVGIDWYAPMSDWREGQGHRDADLGGPYGQAYLAANVGGGEGFDWYYPDEAARRDQVRAAISDGAYGEPWVFRPKDLAGWWGALRHDRPQGVRAPTPSDWRPGMKPIWFMELGAPAVDKGANAPNLFIDPKSAESGTSPFSTGAQDDLIQRRALEAALRHWGAQGPHNPQSAVYGGPMIDPARIFLWAWDARPFPAFPARTDEWGDGANWRYGHWLNGRAGLGDLADAIAELCARAGLNDIDVEALEGVCPWFAIDAPYTARSALQPLLDAYGAFAVHAEGKLRFDHHGRGPVIEITPDDLVDEGPGRYDWSRADFASWPQETRLRYLDVGRDWQAGAASALGRSGAAATARTFDTPLALSPEQAGAAALRLHMQAIAAQESLVFSLPISWMGLKAGDRIAFDPGFGRTLTFRIETIEDGLFRTLKMTRDTGGLGRLVAAGAPASPAPALTGRGRVTFLDLPPLPTDETDARPLAAVRARPWGEAMAVYAGAPGMEASERTQAPAPGLVGETLAPLAAGPAGIWHRGGRVRMRMPGAGLSSVSELQALDGANAFALAHEEGAWEILQARTAELVGPDEWELSGLLRGLLGTEGLARSPVPAGAAIALLDGRLVRIGLKPNEADVGLELFAIAPGASPAEAIRTPITWRRVWARPFAPCHARAGRGADGAVRVSWIRRARLGGDVWGVGEPPLGAESEAYRLRVLRDGLAVRTVETERPEWIYSAADQIADFGVLPGALQVQIAQIAPGYGDGAFLESMIAL